MVSVIVATVAGTAAAVLGVWIAWWLAQLAYATVGGIAGERLAAVIGTIGLFGGIALATWVTIRLRDSFEEAAGRRAAQAWEPALAALRNDPALAHWAPLAERYRSTDPALLTRWERRRRELLADPRRSRWAARTLDGVFPNDLEIDYADDPQLLITCTHLRSLEAALRAQGIRCAPITPTSITTDATLDGRRVIRLHALPDCVEWVEPNGDPRDQDAGALHCRPCQSSIGSGAGIPYVT